MRARRPAASVRTLTQADLPGALRCVERDRVVNVFIDHRIRATRLDPRHLHGEIWGFPQRGNLSALCHIGANLVLANADGEAVEAFAETALARRPHVATMVGRRASVEALWERLRHDWWPTLECRWDQPHLEIRRDPMVAADPAVRRTTSDRMEILYPTCVAMYREEVGVSPEAESGRSLYRQRVSGLINRGWSFSRIENDEVLFKAEVACASPYAAQIQGVYVPPERRNQGLATAGIAAVVQAIRRDIAPVASLYLNAHNVAARTAYDRVGFQQTATFSTLMF